MKPTDGAIRGQSKRVSAAPEILNVETELLTGDVVATIVDRTAGLDLLTVGSRRYGPLKRVPAGGVSLGVLRARRAPCS